MDAEGAGAVAVGYSVVLGVVMGSGEVPGAVDNGKVSDNNVVSQTGKREREDEDEDENDDEDEIEYKREVKRENAMQLSKDLEDGVYPVGCACGTCLMEATCKCLECYTAKTTDEALQRACVMRDDRIKQFERWGHHCWYSRIDYKELDKVICFPVEWYVGIDRYQDLLKLAASLRIVEDPSSKHDLCLICGGRCPNRTDNFLSHVFRNPDPAISELHHKRMRELFKTGLPLTAHSGLFNPYKSVMFHVTLPDSDVRRQITLHFLLQTIKALPHTAGWNRSLLHNLLATVGWRKVQFRGVRRKFKDHTARDFCSYVIKSEDFLREVKSCNFHEFDVEYV